MIELAEIKKQNLELSFNQTVILVVTNLIKKKLSFSDFMLSLAWRMIEDDNKKPEESELFQTIMDTAEAIVNEKDKRDWYWMKKVMLGSHV